MRIAISTFLAAALLVGAAAADEAGWPAYGGDPGANRYSEAPQITPENVRRLTKAWTFRTGHMSYSKELRRRSKFEATPILAEDKVVLCTPFNVVIALDPGTGEEIWRHDPKIDLEQEPANQYNCRGVAYWRDPAAERDAPCAARILTGTNDYRLVAIDLDDGARCDAFGQAGEVKVDPEFDLAWPGEFQITSPPVVIGDTVIVGSAIGDNVSVAAPRGTVRAFDVRSGAPRWSFDPIPRNAASAAAQGWDGAEIPTEGHANVWAPMSADLGRGLVFLPTSSPSPDFFGGARRGDGGVDIVGATHRNRVDHFFRGRVDDVECLVGQRLDPLSIDVELPGVVHGLLPASNLSRTLCRRATDEPDDGGLPSRGCGAPFAE